MVNHKGPSYLLTYCISSNVSPLSVSKFLPSCQPLTQITSAVPPPPLTKLSHRQFVLLKGSAIWGGQCRPIIPTCGPQKKVLMPITRKTTIPLNNECHSWPTHRQDQGGNKADLSSHGQTLTDTGVFFFFTDNL